MNHRCTRSRALRAFVITGLLLVVLAPGLAMARTSVSTVEPNAGSWPTWVLTSGSQFRLPAPPDRAATEAEIVELKAMAQQRDAAARDRIAFWDSGAPGYRWDALVRSELANHGVTMASATTSRQLSLVDVAIYDATVASWDSKYTYNRPRPSDVDPTLETGIANPLSPAYPSEHAAVAGAASAVLAYLFPDDAESFTSLADEAAHSRLLAGVQYPSDTMAGLELGRKVANLVIERARHDGFEVPWSGALPSDPDLWNLDGYPDGTVPVAPNFGSLRTWVLRSGSQLRPPPPPAPDSDQKRAELAELRDFPRTFLTNAAGFYWQSTRSAWPLVLERELFEAHLDGNPPSAARAAALVNIAAFDATVACWDAKFTYWARRPFQLDPEVRPLFQTPAHPSYPAAHGCQSGAQSTVLARLFPADAATLTAQGDEAGMSRLWSGIHFRSDIEAGLLLGRAVGNLVADRGQL
jgi:PAP2 superfamily